LDLNTFVKHLAWIVGLMLVLQVVFYYLLEMIDYNSFLLSVILISTVLFVLVVLFVWTAFRTKILQSMSKTSVTPKIMKALSQCIR